jgi:hypothetical protein
MIKVGKSKMRFRLSFKFEIKNENMKKLKSGINERAHESQENE